MGANMSGYQAYKKTQVQTADQGSLILMCYDGAIGFLKQARQAHRDNDFKSFSSFLIRAQNILWELNNSLNLEAGELAYNLESLYNYMIRRIIDAEYKDSTEPVDEVVGFLEELKESWVKIIKKT